MLLTLRYCLVLALRYAVIFLHLKCWDNFPYSVFDYACFSFKPLVKQFNGDFQRLQTLPEESEGSRFKPHKTLDWALGFNLIMRLPATFGLNQELNFSD